MYFGTRNALVKSKLTYLASWSQKSGFIVPNLTFFKDKDMLFLRFENHQNHEKKQVLATYNVEKIDEVWKKPCSRLTVISRPVRSFLVGWVLKLDYNGWYRWIAWNLAVILSPSSAWNTTYWASYGQNSSQRAPPDCGLNQTFRIFYIPKPLDILLNLWAKGAPT